ncbi:MAG: DNA polymerase-3 subunit delta [Lentimonas sp.]|jgi:DNA polymerase-3 subunit delta
MSVEQIIRDIKAKKFSPVYLLHGDEPYFIDAIMDAIIENGLAEEERDFNQAILYGIDITPGDAINEVKKFPMMAERRIVVVKEAQNLKKADELEAYVANPNPQTIFVFCHKNKPLNGNSKLFKAFKKTAVIFKSDKIKEYQVPNYIEKLVKEKGYSITPKASNLLANHIGSDLARINGELEKLSLLVEKGSTINEVHIEENIGISKDYNLFELINSIAKRDVVKAFSIVSYFKSNPKSGALVPVVSTLFTMHYRLMYLHFSKKSDAEHAKQFRMHPFGLKELKTSLKIYPPSKVSANINTLLEYDLKSKGLGAANVNEHELMRELIFKLMH